MPYDVITIDTNIFDRNGLRLEKGMLAQLGQFREGAIRFVLSEIVYNEVEKHLANRAKEVKSSLERAIKQSTEDNFFSPEAEKQIEIIYDSSPEPEDVAKDRLSAFVEATGAEIIPAQLTKIDDLVRLYFSTSAPFEASEKKKNEFPDAIALLSLEFWARDNDKKILAISADGGWANYARDSDWIDVEDDLGAALQHLQLHIEEANNVIAALLSDVDAERREDLSEEITRAIANAVGKLSPFPEYAADYDYEVGFVSMQYNDNGFLKEGDSYKFNAVRVSENVIVANIRIYIDATADCEFALNVWDGIDKDYVFLGSRVIDVNVRFNAAILVTFEGDFINEPEEIEITSVYLNEEIDRVDFGEVNALDDEFYE